MSLRRRPKRVLGIMPKIRTAAGAVESQGGTGPDAGNLGLRLGTESAKQEPTQTSFTPCLAAVNEMSPNLPPGSQSVFGGPEIYTAQEWNGRKYRKCGNFSKMRQ